MTLKDLTVKWPLWEDKTQGRNSKFKWTFDPGSNPELRKRQRISVCKSVLQKLFSVIFFFFNKNLCLSSSQWNPGVYYQQQSGDTVPFISSTGMERTLFTVTQQHRALALALASLHVSLAVNYLLKTSLWVCVFLLKLCEVSFHFRSLNKPMPNLIF